MTPRHQTRETTRPDDPPATSRGLRLAYLASEYPKVSHTFVRREILELERLGFFVLRVSIRDCRADLVDPVDVAEATKTFFCLERGLPALLAAFLLMAVTRPIRLIDAMSRAVRMGWRSDAGLLRHVAYLLEACLLRRLMARERIDHVHAHFGANAATVAYLIRRLGGPSYSITIHGPLEFDAPRGYHLGEKVEHASFVAVITSFASAQLRRWVDAGHWDKIHVVRCTAGDLDAAPAPIDPESRTFLSVGRLCAAKGQLVLVEALAELVAEGRAVRLVLAGDGEIRPVIERRIRELDLGDHIDLPGWIDGDAVNRYLAECRVFVQSSFAEGLPVVIMEAFANARPVIATTIAGIPELVEHGRNGWLVIAGDSAGIADAMRAALDTPIARLDEMGAAGRTKVCANHDTHKEVSKLASLFESNAD